MCKYVIGINDGFTYSEETYTSKSGYFSIADIVAIIEANTDLKRVPQRLPKTEEVESHGKKATGAADHKDGYNATTSTHKLVESLPPDPLPGNSGQQPQPEICLDCEGEGKVLMGVNPTWYICGWCKGTGQTTGRA